MNEIQKIEAYKIGDKLFETIEEANYYKYQKIDDIQLGEIVSTNGFSTIFGNVGAEGTVCCIENDLIWFLDGYCRHEWIMKGTIKWNFEGYIEGHRYCWKIMNRYRKDLWKKPLEFRHCNIKI